MLENGILYIATGEQYVNEAIKSARSLDANTKGYPTKLIANRDPHEDVFDNVQIVEPREGFADKIRFLQETPYERTLFLDSDTYVCGPIHDLFELIEQYELAAAHARGRRPVRMEEIPDCFPEFNTGVLVYRSSSNVDNILSQWLAEYNKIERQSSLNDQPAFRRTLYGADVNMATLPPEYNCRTVWPGYADGPVKIIHGRHDNLEAIADKLNKSTEMRVFLPNDDEFKVKTRHKPSLIERALNRYRKDGIQETIQHTIDYLK